MQVVSNELLTKPKNSESKNFSWRNVSSIFSSEFMIMNAEKNVKKIHFFSYVVLSKFKSVWEKHEKSVFIALYNITTIKNWETWDLSVVFFSRQMHAKLNRISEKKKITILLSQKKVYICLVHCANTMSIRVGGIHQLVEWLLEIQSLWSFLGSGARYVHTRVL